MRKIETVGDAIALETLRYISHVKSALECSRQRQQLIEQRKALYAQEEDLRGMILLFVAEARDQAGALFGKGLSPESVAAIINTDDLDIIDLGASVGSRHTLSEEKF